MKAPLVSIVVPAYNCEAHLGETLDTLLAQSYPELEIVVIDDGSTDGTPQVLDRYRGKVVHKRQPNGGLAAARNAGMQLARGELIAWADADDLYLPEKILVQAAYLSENPSVVASGTNFSAFDQTGEFDAANASKYYTELGEKTLEGIFPKHESFDGTKVPWLTSPLPKDYAVHHGEVWKRIIFGNFMHPPTMMIRKTAIEKVGWLKSGIRGSEDWEYLIRLAHVGPLAFIDASLLRYRYHANQMSSVLGTLVAPISKIAVLESTLRNYGDELGELRRGLCSKLAEFKAEAAYAYAEEKPFTALRYLVDAATLDRKQARLAFNLVRILMPRHTLQTLRRIRGLDMTVPYKRRVMNSPPR